ncbi:unnamed protein product [Caenorhabditis auriculariae]|uniref:Uncharacterized protein n=1 Tax=Caenorhabditis auriculariae TaxID=2777116 RepID=A0A8S1GV43_9PELO|nr:unnamed protein product [Caenorhabditis auriculariae]
MVQQEIYVMSCRAYTRSVVCPERSVMVRLFFPWLMIITSGMRWKSVVVLCSFLQLVAAAKRCEPITVPLCKGIGYNMTSFPNSYGHEKQEEAGLEVHQFFPLVEVGCYQHLKFFLCTLYTPICQDNYDRAILPCQELCLEARKRCSPIMQKYGFRWPETLSCDALPKMSDQMTSGNICAAPPDTPKQLKPKEPEPPLFVPQNRPEVGISVERTDCQCTCNLPFQYIDNDRSKVMNVSNCAYPCHSPAYEMNKGLINNWMAFWSITCCVLSAFTFLTFIIETDRFQYPERPIFMLAFCQFMVSIGFIIRFSAGHDEVACEAFKIKGSDDNSGSLCFGVFLLTYFFGMAASVWWVILSLTWVLAAASKWSTEAIAAYSFHFHVVGWLVPAVQTVLVLIFNAIDGDPITGICYVGNTDVNFLRLFVLGPLVVYFSLGVLFLAVGFFNLWTIRNEVQKQHPGLDNASKLTQLMSKIGIFSVLYTLPSFIIILVLFYEQKHRPLWEEARLCSCAADNLRIGDSSLFVALMKTACMCVVGWTSGFWVCSTKTLSSWRNALCCLGQSHSGAKYQPADLLYAKSDMSSPHFFNTHLRRSSTSHFLNGPIKARDGGGRLIFAMEWILRHHSIQSMPLYNCSGKTSEEWTRLYGVPRSILGHADLLYGIFVELCYLPCMWVMLQKECIRLSCFKIMFLLGLVDMCAIAVNSIETGILLIEGAVYCSHPEMIYITGSIGLGLWCCACLVCLILVINRLFDILYPTLVKTYFAGSRTTLVLLVPITYGIYFTLFTSPLLFTSQYQAWFFDPFIHEGLSMEYQNFPHTANNMFIVVSTCLLYGYFCLALRKQFKRHYESTHQRSNKQVEIFLQSTLICMVNFVAAMVYVYMQFFPVPDFVIVIGHISWQLGHGCPALIYLLMNRTIRTGVSKFFKFRVTWKKGDYRDDDCDGGKRPS